MLYNKDMKQLLTLVLVVSVFAVSLPMTAAQDDVDTSVEQTEEIEDVGLLPNNPFYFLKEWGRGVQRALIFDPVKRADFELRVTDEKAEELRRVGETDGDNTLAIQRASQNYEKAMERLRLRLEKAQEQTDNPNVDRLLERVTNTVGEHERRLERISDRFEEVNQLRERIRTTRDRFQNFIDPTLRDVENLDRLKDRAGEVLEGQREELRERLDQVDLRELPDQVDRFRDQLRIQVDKGGLKNSIELEARNRVGDLRKAIDRRTDLRNDEN